MGDAANVDDLRQQLRDRTQEAMQRVCDQIFQDLRDLAPVGEVNGGATRDAITEEPLQSSGDQFSCKFSLPDKDGNQAYGGEYVETGTVEHIVVPVNAKALHFFIGDGEVFAKRVQIPAMPARPWFHPVTDTFADRISQSYL